jgi:HAD superfamily hydrolase (TIGR01509 family)
VRLRGLRGVFFDLDDTLFDHGAALQRLDAHGGANAPRGTDAFALALAAHVEPEPGIAELVAELARTRRVAIVTNGSGAAQREKLRRIGLADVIHAVFVSGELGVAKPAPELFRHALAWSELPASECIFVGDDPHRDLAPAAVLGMVTCWRIRGDARWPAEQHASSFVARTVGDLREALA